MPPGTTNNEPLQSENIPDNPYQPQTESGSIADGNVVANGGDVGGISETALRYLKEATPWLRFIGIMGFVGCGFTALVGVVFLVAAPFIPDVLTNRAFGAAGALGGLLYIGMAVICFFPARFIYGFGTRLRNYLKNNAVTELELALKNNKSFWKFYGIITIVGMAIIPITIVITLVVAVGATLF